MNISEFAQKVGVSKATVSNYLNNKTDKMSAKTHLRIQNAIEQYDYVPNLGARYLANVSNKSKTIGIVLENTTLRSLFDTAFFSHIHRGISDVFQKTGYRSLIIPEQDESQQESSLEYIKGLGKGLVDGFLLFNIQENDTYISSFTKMKIPFMCFGQIQKLPIRNYVGSEHSNGIKIALEHFFEKNIKKVAMFVGMSSSIVAMQLQEGYIQFYEKQNIPINKNFIIYSKQHETESIYADCIRLFKSHDMPQAFILSRIQLDDLLRAAKNCNKIPCKDFFFILTSYFPVNDRENTYSYIKAPVYDLGKEAAEKLILQINGEEITPKMFPMELVCRMSCGCNSV